MNTVDFYLRLSLEDDDLKDESNSITSQREILKDYISSREEFTGVKIREHIDDGYTGTNFNRPAFQKMIGLVKKNEIRTILVKDLSRFARDYIESGAYTLFVTDKQTQQKNEQLSLRRPYTLYI